MTRLSNIVMIALICSSWGNSTISSQIQLKFSPSIEYFNYHRYDLSNIGADAYLQIGKHWNLFYHIRIGMPTNQTLYYHVGVPQAISGFCFQQWWGGGSMLWGGVGLLTGWLPEGIGYRWNHKRCSSQLNLSMWGFDAYNKKVSNEKWSFPSQTIQYRITLIKAWRSIASFSPYLAVTLNDNSWEMNMPALGWRLGCGVTLKKREKRSIQSVNPPPVPAEEQFN